jgi:hypothetical protein
VPDPVVGGAELRSIDTSPSEHGAEVRLHRRSVGRHESLLAAIDERDRAGLAATEFGSLVQDALQHRVAFARVLPDQAQHFGGCGLEVQRLLEIYVARVDVDNEPSGGDRIARLDCERLQKVDLLARERNRLLSQRRDPERGPSCGTTSGQWCIHRRLEAELVCGRHRLLVLRAGECGLVLERDCDTSVEDLREKEHRVVCPTRDDAADASRTPAVQVDRAVRASEEDARNSRIGEDRRLQGNLVEECIQLGALVGHRPQYTPEGSLAAL